MACSAKSVHLFKYCINIIRGLHIYIDRYPNRHYLFLPVSASVTAPDNYKLELGMYNVNNKCNFTPNVVTAELHVVIGLVIS